MLLEYWLIAGGSILLGGSIYPILRHHLRIKHWQHVLALKPHQRVFDSLYHQVNGHALSRQEREVFDGLEFVYGEIEFLSFIALLSLVKPNKNTVFYDLGCGTGKAVVACAMVYPVRKAVGIEYFPSLYHCATQQKQRLTQLTAYAMQNEVIQFVLNDYFNESLVDATLIFINASTLIGSTWEKVTHLLEMRASQATIITTSKPLHSSYFIMQRTTQVLMSWGIVSAYIHAPTGIATKQLENIE